MWSCGLPLAFDVFFCGFFSTDQIRSFHATEVIRYGPDPVKCLSPRSKPGYDINLKEVL